MRASLGTGVLLLALVLTPLTGARAGDAERAAAEAAKQRRKALRELAKELLPRSPTHQDPDAAAVLRAAGHPGEATLAAVRRFQAEFRAQAITGQPAPRPRHDSIGEMDLDDPQEDAFRRRLEAARKALATLLEDLVARAQAVVDPAAPALAEAPSPRGLLGF